MSVVAAAIIGGSVVSAFASSSAASSASRSAEAGADAAAQAQIISTELQIEEMARQFDYQQTVLTPQIQQQFNAQRAYSDLLGFGGVQANQNAETGYVTQARPMDEQQRIRQRDIDSYNQFVEDGLMTRARADEAIAEIGGQPYDQQRLDESAAGRGATMGAPGSSGLGPGRDMGIPGGYAGPGRDTGGGFVDPNLSGTQLADIETLSGTVQQNLLAGTTAEDDPYRNFLTDTSLDQPGGLEGDMVRQDVAGRSLAGGAAGTDIYGDVFQESPGYAFQREEMERQLERQGSAGGPNIGGRAIVEAQRRAQGLAAGDYYNWAQGRSRDVDRLTQAEATDAGRLDRTAYNYQDTQRREQGRGDQGYQDYMRRREGDVSRIDAAAAGVDRLQGVDRQRQDQGYYNYLNSLSRAAGFGGGAASQAVTASQQQASNVAGAYRSQGNNLSQIYGQAGTDQANIAYNEYAGYNNAIQGGVSNWITYQNSLAPQTTPPIVQ